jgi:hypothetical protein
MALTECKDTMLQDDDYIGILNLLHMIDDALENAQ